MEWIGYDVARPFHPEIGPSCHVVSRRIMVCHGKNATALTEEADVSSVSFWIAGCGARTVRDKHVPALFGDQLCIAAHGKECNVGKEAVHV
jgi:hypothetical protein